MPERNKIVAKHNDLIPSLAKMELMELRLLAYCLSKVDSRADEDFPVIKAKVKDMADLYEMKHKDVHRMVKTAVKSIAAKPAEYEEDGREKLRFWFIGMDYVFDSGEFEFQFHPDLKSRLLGLKDNFTSYRIKDVYQFKAASSWRLYEALRQWKEAGKVEFDLGKLRLLTGVAGLYPRFADLKNRIIEPGIEDINKSSDIQVQWERIKRGRKIVGVRFFIAENQATKSQREKTRDLVKENLDQAGKDLDVDPGQAFRVKFPKPPPEETREALRANGFRWNGEAKAWENPHATKAQAKLAAEAAQMYQGSIS